MKTINGISYTKFAKRVGISLPYLSNIISGRSKPSIDLALRLEFESNGELKAMKLRHEIKQIVKKYL
jgi:transcriptional regulator with XRE-family HTH domain